LPLALQNKALGPFDRMEQYEIHAAVLAVDISPDLALPCEDRLLQPPQGEKVLTGNLLVFFIQKGLHGDFEP
jgi:hypothetical protein